MWAKWGSGEGGEGAPGSRGEREREGWEEANGRIFQVPRAKKLEQETGKGLPSNQMQYGCGNGGGGLHVEADGHYMVCRMSSVWRLILTLFS